MSVERLQGQWVQQPLQQQMQQMPQEAAEPDGTETQSEETHQGEELPFFGETKYSEFMEGLLKDAAPEHKEIIAPYLTKFNSGVQRRFQDQANKYKHYESLGWDEETTQQMAEVYRVLNDEPETLYEILKAEFEENVQEAQKVVEGEGTDPDFQGQLPPEVMQQLTQQQQVLEALAQYVIDDHTSKTTAVEDSEFESYMGLLKDEYGDFDEEYVVAMVANGQDGEAAVKKWQSMAQEILNKAASSVEGLPPAMLSSAGGGAVAQQEPQKLGSYSSKDIKQLITNVLTQSNQASQ